MNFEVKKRRRDRREGNRSRIGRRKGKRKTEIEDITLDDEEIGHQRGKAAGRECKRQKMEGERTIMIRLEYLMPRH